MMWIVCAALASLTLLLAFLFWHHQRLLHDRAFMMREAIRNREFMFRLPTRGLFFGERALQQTLNDIGQDVRDLVAQNEVESWQRLTRVLTHEIMNATTPIQSISQAYLSMPEIHGSPFEEGLRAIHDTSRSLASFVESYRRLTQLQHAVPTTITLSAFAQSLEPLFPTLIWHFDIAPSATLVADEHMLRQTCINLVKNAAEAGATHIALRTKDKALLLSNDGMPIPPEMRREIFVPFFTTKTTGSGFGLSLSRQMLMATGLSLTLEERPEPGYHVTFSVTPLSK